MRDRVFYDYDKGLGAFRFDKEVATVFDDMLDRSVPFYREVTRMCTEIIKKHYQPNTHLYDIGSSTGTMLMALTTQDPSMQPFLRGIEPSSEMISEAIEAFEKGGLDSRNIFINEFVENVEFLNSSVMISNYTFQFIAPQKRDALVKKIYDALVPGGCFIISEKINCDDPHFQSEFIDHYFNFKRRNGYSNLEIANKRDALEKVLLPLTPSETRSMLKSSGFDHVEVFFRWYNFQSILAIKENRYKK